MSGTGSGQALLVEIEGPGALPVVTPLPTGAYRWMKLSAKIEDRAGIDRLDSKLRSIGGDLDRVLVDLIVEGVLSLEDSTYFQERIVEGTSAALCHL